ncbi:ATP-binding protein [Edaphobacter albus]|uniref:ATP-binding protein n=1 Tax=Edaphobacter sp. 4G125 TaxID=2763071 RepID=UPI001648465E|nr:ATP-binding protein [Edaphobacter sp. 4G125]QNI38003.1 PAS domain S-box protein [Edaphobacter sp. 4G125]
MLSLLFQGSRTSVSVRAGLLIAAIAVLDLCLAKELPMGFLYLLPMLMVGRVFGPWSIGVVALLCTALTEIFDAFAWNLRTGLPRDALYFVAFFCVGLFVYEANRNRQIVLGHLHEIELQRDARLAAEEQLRVLIESSPAAIITADADGCVLMANQAAHRMLSLAPLSLPGRSIHYYFPSLANISRRDSSHQLLRAVMQARGQRDDGEVFLADICFSTYQTGNGSRMAAMILDTSEDLRSREESSLHQILAGSRIVASALSHEIRNICGAIAVVYENFSRSGLLVQNKDFEALGNLVLALEKIADVDLRQSTDQVTAVDLTSVLEDLRIVIAPSLREEGIASTWNLRPDLPPVWADRSSLLQVFLNLATNSIRALSNSSDKHLTIATVAEGHRILVEFTDSGGGVEYPERLFHPFQQGAQATGLGLYVSRAFMRSFGGELRYRPLPDSACFVIELTPTVNGRPHE